MSTLLITRHVARRCFSGLAIAAVLSIYAAATASEELTQDSGLRRIYQDTTSRTAITLEQFRGRDTMWLLCVGQSNAANSGENPRGIQVNVFNYFDGKVYPAKDPLLGATGRGSNVWTALGTELVRRKLAAKVVLVPFAVGGTSIERWQPNERVGQRLSEILSILRADKIHVDFVLWEQGESDDNLSGLEYSQRLLRVKGIFSVSGQNAPMIVALASRKRSGILPEVRRGQQMAAELVPCVFPGPDADSVFGPKARPEGIHFSTFGQDQLAVMWADSIQNALSKQRRCGS